MSTRPATVALTALAFSIVLSGCSVRQVASDALADTLSGSGTAFARDDDPELVAAATPFALKTMEAVLDSSPEHQGLLLALARGFTQYAYAFVQLPADVAEDEDFEVAQRGRARARGLYLRARDYGLRGLELARPGLMAELRAEPETALARLDAADVPVMYWSAAAWGAAIALGQDDPLLVADLPLVEQLARRALELDETFGEGALHTFLMSIEMSRLAPQADKVAAARELFERALEVSGGRQAGPYVTYAESVATALQDRAAFVENLEAALAVDARERPESTLVNVVMQRRAAWLLERVDDLFLD